ncbi:type II toxin-antitoxin system RelE family toxin [Halobellus clavatus]|jgi:mRNA-degrading endonuclease RelE of RelBE toxin-antitoxin system|uniref:mRNA-degrading endonuclease RelE, toxin component of the RelBE toxin-antitoxin system n=1 Tax=Halobellus clavatus TaxID=660517 RepID=A0A1H3KHI8_9EURY|nr:type II toxin-antitoxin system RelE/ParE family toxin [Halobellus clavatus]SDY51500.1 mRNA-degrading endonuclease RelE, toxin component of the RelBE toxin-antitoxin system [Halobellus clavatus]
MSEDEWSWEFKKPAKRTYDDLDEHAQNRITDKLDEIVNDQWRDPDEYMTPLTGAPHSRIRIGQFRLGCECDYEKNILVIFTIERRRGAYKADDD